ncbi:MAG: MarR family transcriptional regulator [Pseudomonadota bacterium]
MAKDTQDRIRLLFDRLQRLIASEDWAEDLNPAQRSALSYLARANRFSRSPSNVADYLCTTRGTASQTLKTLDKKGMIRRCDSDGDKRGVTYDVTKEGHTHIEETDALDRALGSIAKEKVDVLEGTLADLLTMQLEARGFRSFGICRTCIHHETDGKRLYCRLLEIPLKSEEADLICHEHKAA